MSEPMESDAGATESEAGATTPGLCEGPDSLYLKLVSTDGFEFYVKRSAALCSCSNMASLLGGPSKYIIAPEIKCIIFVSVVMHA